VKIALVEPVGKGGLAHYAFQLARALAAEGAEVALVTDRTFELADLPREFALVQPFELWDPKPERDRAPRLLRRARRLLRGLRWAAAWVSLARALRRLRPDRVQLGDLRFAGDLGGVLLLRALGLRLADVCHNVEPFALAGAAAGEFRRSARSRFVYRAIYRRMERVFVHYESNRVRFLERYGLPQERVVAIPHGDESLFRELADPAVDAAALRRRLELPGSARVVLLFGSLSRYKGVDLLLESFARVVATNPDAHLAIAGFANPDFDLAAHRELAERLGVAKRTRWAPGYVPAQEVAAWMELADVAVFPYRELSQSGALAIALTFGRPVVATRVGAMAEVVRDGETGRLVLPGDAGALAAALGDLLVDRARAARMGERAALEMRERASWRAIARTLLSAYQEAEPGSAR
jgi:glycosyltransferase involved in cell wall biosynthesis